MNEIIVISKEQLREILIEAIQAALAELGMNKDSMRAKYYTRQEVLKIWNISLSTLYRYEKLGQVKPLHVGSRCFYEKTYIDQIDIGKLKGQKSA